MPSFGPLPILFGGTATPFDNVGDIINDAAILLGIGNSEDPIGSSDPNYIQLRTMLKIEGRTLRMKREWAQLNQYYTFTTVQGQSLYPLPSGFGRIINDTIWNITNRLPVPGPLTPEEWSYLKARLVGVTFNVLFRQYQQQIQLFPDTDTPGDWELAYEFTSRNWLQTASASAPDKTEPDANSDVVWFDPTVVTLGCVLRFQQAHKMATAASQDAYDVALQDAMDDDGGAPDLRLDSLGRDLALIGERNIPLTGFGGV